MRKTENIAEDVPQNPTRRTLLAGGIAAALTASLVGVAGWQLTETTPTQDDAVKKFFNFITERGNLASDDVSRGVLPALAGTNANASYEFQDIGNYINGPAGQGVNWNQAINKPVANSGVEGIPPGLSVTALDVAVYVPENPNYAHALFAEGYQAIPTTQTFQLLKQHIDEEREALPSKIGQFADSTQSEITALKQLLDEMAGQFPAIAKQAGYPDKIQPIFIADGMAAPGTNIIGIAR